MTPLSPFFASLCHRPVQAQSDGITVEELEQKIQGKESALETALADVDALLRHKSGHGYASRLQVALDRATGAKKAFEEAIDGLSIGCAALSP